MKLEKKFVNFLLRTHRTENVYITENMGIIIL